MLSEVYYQLRIFHNIQHEYMLKNGHGDVTQLISGCTINESYDYDAYGVEKDIDSSDDNPFKYCGEYQDLCSGLIYLRNRYYEPNTGRYINEDIISLRANLSV